MTDYHKPGPKQVFNGVAKLQVVNRGSKSEHEAVVLETADGKVHKLDVEGLNPFRDPALDAFVGKRVSVEGREYWGGKILVDRLSDIKVRP